MVRSLAILLLAGVIQLAAVPAYAQNSADPFQPSAEGAGGVVGLFDQSAGALATESVTMESNFTTATGDRPAILAITARIAPGKHIYSTTQPPGGPQPTQIELEPSRDYRLLAPLHAHPQPHKRIEQGEIWTGLE
ncbi:MAG TPA: hypothetical protein VGK58_17660, partial [Lacipirellulaceae bacterium]